MIIHSFPDADDCPSHWHLSGSYRNTYSSASTVKRNREVWVSET